MCVCGGGGVCISNNIVSLYMIMTVYALSVHWSIAFEI